MAKELDTRRNHRYVGQGRHDEAMRMKVQQLYASPALKRPTLVLSGSNESHSRHHSYDSSSTRQSNGERNEPLGDFNQTTSPAFRKRSDNINNTDVHRSVVVKSRTARLRPVSNSGMSCKNATILTKGSEEIKEKTATEGCELYGNKNKHFEKDLGSHNNAVNVESVSRHVNRRHFRPVDQHQNTDKDQVDVYNKWQNIGSVNAGINSEDSANYGGLNSNVIDGNPGRFEMQRNNRDGGLNCEISNFTNRVLKQREINNRFGTSQDLEKETEDFKSPAENMDEGRRIRVEEKKVSIRRASVDMLQDKNAAFTTRKLSQVSQDLMKSKEELINRSRQCGLMLEQYKKREEEKRENPVGRDSFPKYGQTDRSSFRGSFEDRTESEYSYDGERLSQVDKTTVVPKIASLDASQNTQSPRIPRRKSSYIDSWLQSQQSRISTLVSAIKEDPDEDTREEARDHDNLRRSRASSVPPDSSLFLSWGRSDDSSFDGDDPTRVSHARTSSGEEIMGISTNSPRLFSNTRSARWQSPMDSPRSYHRGAMQQQTSNASEDSNSQRKDSASSSLSEKTAEILAIRKSMNTRRRRPESAYSLDTTNKESFEARPRENGSPRLNFNTRSGRCSDVQQGVSDAQRKSPNSQLKLKKETTFDAEVTTNIVPAEKTANSSPRPTSSPRAMVPQRSSLPRQQNIEDLEGQNDNISRDNSVPTGTTPPFSNGRIFQERHLNLDGSRHFPVAVVKPLQHGKSQSLDRTHNGQLKGDSHAMNEIKDRQKRYSGQDHVSDLHRNDLSVSRSSIVTNLDDLIDFQKLQVLDPEFAPAQQTVSSYNVEIARPERANETVSLKSRGYDEMPVDVEEHSGNERAVDVGPEGLPVSSPNFIMQDFHWYSEKSRNTFAKGQSLPQDSTQEKLERLGKSKRGSKLFESKYVNSFSKSLENLSKIGKDYIKSRRKSVDKSAEKTQKNRADSPDLHAKANEPSTTAGKAQIVGDLELNEEFARKMERKSRRYSMDVNKLKSIDVEARSRDVLPSSETRLQETKISPAHAIPGISKKERNVIQKVGLRNEMEIKFGFEGDLECEKDFKADKIDSVRHSKRIVEIPSISRKENIELETEIERFDAAISSTQGNSRAGTSPKPAGISPKPAYRDAQLSSSTQGASPERADEYTKLRNSPNNHYSSHANIIAAASYADASNADTSNSDASNATAKQENKAYLRIVQQQQHEDSVTTTTTDTNGFVIDDDDQDEKEMVKIARKISTLRSSQYKKKPASSAHDVHSGVQDADMLRSSGSNISSQNSDFQQSGEDSILTSSELQQTSDDYSSPMQTSDVDRSSKQTSDVDSSSQQTSDAVDRSEHERGAVKRISTSLSRVMTDLRELREQDMTLASQLIGLGKSIKHFKKQKKDMEDFYAMLGSDDDDDSSDYSDSSNDEY